MSESGQFNSEWLRTNANSTTSNDHNILRGLKALLPLGHELTNVRVALWIVDGTSPLGSSRQHEDCETEKTSDDRDPPTTEIN